MDLDEGLQAFVTEAGELLAEMEAGLLKLGEHSAHEEAVNAIFRSAHTIKGTAGLFGLDYIVLFTHAVESVLEEVRNGTRAARRRTGGAAAGLRRPDRCDGARCRARRPRRSW